MNADTRNQDEIEGEALGRLGRALDAAGITYRNTSWHNDIGPSVGGFDARDDIDWQVHSYVHDDSVVHGEDDEGETIIVDAGRAILSMSVAGDSAGVFDVESDDPDAIVAAIRAYLTR